MRNKNRLIIEQLDRKLKPFQKTKDVQMPDSGWVKHIRSALNMTLEQLGNRIKMTKQGVLNIERRESSGSISIRSLKEIGNAMEMQFVYGFVPNHGSIETFIDMKAKELAKKIVLRTNQHMKLENQGTSDKKIKDAIVELTEEIKREMPKILWE